MIIYPFLLIFLGVLAVPSISLSKKPDVKELIDKLTPYVGAGSCLLGIYFIIQCLADRYWLEQVPFLWIVSVIGSVVQIVLGFIMGYEVIAKYVSSMNAEIAEKVENFLAKLTPLKSIIGIVAIILGAAYIIVFAFLFIVLFLAYGTR